MSDAFSSTDDKRISNNVMRHNYRKLSEAEQNQMQDLKDIGLALWKILDAMGESNELDTAKIRSEEAVMWGVKHITG